MGLPNSKNAISARMYYTGKYTEMILKEKRKRKKRLQERLRHQYLDFLRKKWEESLEAKE